MEKFKALSSVTLFLVRKRNGKTEVLLQKRKGSVMLSGMWDGSASGHVEATESMTQCVIREAREELGVEIRREDIVHTVLQHSRYADVVYYNGYFFVKDYRGTPKIGEPEKCAEIAWYAVDALPETFLKNKAQAVGAFMEGVAYVEYGW